MVSNNDFIEHAEVFGNFYGTPKIMWRKSGFWIRRHTGNRLARARQIQSVKREAVSIFVAPPTKQELENRLRKRGRFEETISIRMSQATSDMKKPIYNYVVVNDCLKPQ